MSLKNQNAPGDGGQNVQEFARLVQMIEEAAAERRIEYTVRRDVPHIVADELQVRKIDLGLHVAAGFDVRFAYIESHRLKSQPREFDRVAPFEGAQVGDAQAGFVAGKGGIEDAPCR